MFNFPFLIRLVRQPRQSPDRWGADQFSERLHLVLRLWPAKRNSLCNRFPGLLRQWQGCQAKRLDLSRSAGSRPGLDHPVRERTTRAQAPTQPDDRFRRSQGSDIYHLEANRCWTSQCPPRSRRCHQEAEWRCSTRAAWSCSPWRRTCRLRDRKIHIASRSECAGGRVVEFGAGEDYFVDRWRENLSAPGDQDPAVSEQGGCVTSAGRIHVASRGERGRGLSHHDWGGPATPKKRSGRASMALRDDVMIFISVALRLC